MWYIHASAHPKQFREVLVRMWRRYIDAGDKTEQLAHLRTEIERFKFVPESYMDPDIKDTGRGRKGKSKKRR